MTKSFRVLFSASLAAACVAVLITGSPASGLSVTFSCNSLVCTGGNCLAVCDGTVDSGEDDCAYWLKVDDDDPLYDGSGDCPVNLGERIPCPLGGTIYFIGKDGCTGQSNCNEPPVTKSFLCDPFI